eukprot:PhM_4_TR8383/c0_g1_i1/m.11856
MLFLDASQPLRFHLSLHTAALLGFGFSARLFFFAASIFQLLLLLLVFLLLAALSFFFPFPFLLQMNQLDAVLLFGLLPLPIFDLLLTATAFLFRCGFSFSCFTSQLFLMKKSLFFLLLLPLVFCLLFCSQNSLL